ncbi:Site-specific recombinase XerD [Pedobacter sp. ok626]|jgi:site-specific recombinase XerD|uniref:site-specific integrase n=1 Tax=Pedobacter sp. ok626 TaxID=1761882 RepID=UPI0008840F27|nr:site-specific integrase [Pedobacter sp. ok626]SDL66933.1 Site-specific recombinase XerD [Pedobacter sp. ok626]
MKKQTIDDLLMKFDSHLRELRRHSYTISQYWQIWKLLRTYMSNSGITYFDPGVGKEFIDIRLGKYDYNSLDRQQKRLVNVIDALYLFQKSGTIALGRSPQRRKPPLVFEGKAGEVIKTYIETNAKVYSLRPGTIYKHTIALHEFLAFITSEGLVDVSELAERHILALIELVSSKSAYRRFLMLTVVKGFLGYIYEEGLTGKDLSFLIPKTNYKSQPKLPSVYSSDEIKSVLSTIDRSSAIGKRNYAMLLLATKLGLRISDIAGLTFENFNWDTGIIKLYQFKTGKEITLPILPEVGNAIINYLKYGRPVSDDNHCFLKHFYPYLRLNPQDVSYAARYYFRHSKVDVKDRKHGAHALRHSFATHLLDNNVSFPVISETLGHSQTESTMYYLRVSKQQLSQCALDVLLVPISFYTQEGGFAS